MAWIVACGTPPFRLELIGPRSVYSDWLLEFRITELFELDRFCIFRFFADRRILPRLSEEDKCDGRKWTVHFRLGLNPVWDQTLAQVHLPSPGSGALLLLSSTSMSFG